MHQLTTPASEARLPAPRTTSPIRSGRVAALLKKSLLLALAAAATTSMPALAASPPSTSWDLASEFSATVPSTVWSHGSRTGLPNTFVQFMPWAATSTFCLTGWTTSLPLVAQNPAFNTCITGGLSFASRAVVLHPGMSGQAAVVRFNAPQTAQYRVSGQFYGIDANGSGTHTSVSIMANLNGTTTYPVYNGTVALTQPNTPSAASFTSFYVMLKAGQSLDFVVKAGPGNNYFFGSTGLNALIERSGDWCGLVNPADPTSSTC